ncbi:MAG: hypothetical protein JWM95_3792 [Gemmatimonadetes bacterium]|nr:hypothetical protein [Gemmatimonadota bacterium]
MTGLYAGGPKLVIDRVLQKVSHDLLRNVRHDLDELRADGRELNHRIDGLQREVVDVRRQLRELRIDGLRAEFASREARITARFAALFERIAQMHAELQESAMPELPRSVSTLDRMWRLSDQNVPLSCSDEEGLVMYETIVANGLMSGFEIATAFGFSTGYLATALQANGGSLVTMDCYVEEWIVSDKYTDADLEEALARTRENIARGLPPAGLAKAKRIAAALGVAPSVDFQVGLSPQAVPGILAGRHVDFAFIDGGHHGDQPSQDFRAVAPFLAHRCAVFFHDNYPGARPIESAITEAEAHLGSRAVRLETRNFLTIITRGFPPTMIESLHPLVVRSGLGLT